MRTLELAESLLDLVVASATLEVHFQYYYEDLQELVDISYMRTKKLR